MASQPSQFSLLQGTKRPCLNKTRQTVPEEQHVRLTSRLPCHAPQCMQTRGHLKKFQPSVTTENFQVNAYKGGHDRT